MSPAFLILNIHLVCCALLKRGGILTFLVNVTVLTPDFNHKIWDIFFKGCEGFDLSPLNIPSYRLEIEFAYWFEMLNYLFHLIIKITFWYRLDNFGRWCDCHFKLWNIFMYYSPWANYCPFSNSHSS